MLCEGRNIFPLNLFSELHHCIDRKPATGLLGQVRITEGFVTSRVQSTKPVYKQADHFNQTWMKAPAERILFLLTILSQSSIYFLPLSLPFLFSHDHPRWSTPGKLIKLKAGPGEGWGKFPHLPGHVPKWVANTSIWEKKQKWETAPFCSRNMSFFHGSFSIAMAQLFAWLQPGCEADQADHTR